jgi:tripartite-type tricarboxylate transporter receptor subunit TctC
MATGLEKELGTTVQVANKPGAASQLALTELTRAAPDGYTLSYAVLPTVTTHYLDPTRAAVYTRANFQPIAMHHLTWMMLAVKTESPYKTLKELVEAARAKPEGIRISDSGLMAVPHTQVVMLELVTGVRFASVHFTGGAPSVTALLGGHVEALAGSTADSLAHKKTGQFRVLGVAAEQPDPSMPDVPTMKSLGYDVVAASAAGILAPAGTPKPVVDKLTRAMKAVIESPEHQAKMKELGIGTFYQDPEGYTKYWIDTENRMRPLMEKVSQQK